MVARLDGLEDGSRDIYGAKAWMLSQASRLGHRVPAGIVASTRECDEVIAHWRAEHAVLLRCLVNQTSPDDCINHSDVCELTFPAPFVQELIKAMCALRAETGGSRFIVRSSASAEDSGARAQAGQFYSEADVLGDEHIQVAVSRVLLSYLWRREHGRAEGGIAVLLQVRVPSDLSGVAFSCNPVTGDPDEVVVAYREGDCGRVTDGTAPAREVSIRLGHMEPDACEPSPAAVQRRTRANDSTISPFSHNLVRALTDFGRLLESPVDIEWAVAKGDFYILQVRPVTRVAFWQDPLANLPLDEGTYERAAARPLHRHSWHWLEVGDSANAEAFARFGEDFLQCEHRVINAYVYRRIRVDRSRYDRDKERRLVLREAPVALAHWEEGKSEFLCRLRQLNRASLTLLPLPELKACYREVVGLATDAQRAHDTLQRPVRIASQWVQELAERLVGYGEMQSMALLDEPGVLETDFLERVSALSVDTDNNTVPGEQLQDIAGDFGYQFASFDDLYSPLSWETWEEDPGPLRLLCAVYQQGARRHEREARRQEVLEARRAVLAHAEEADPEAGALLQRVLNLAVQYMAARVHKDMCLSLALAVHRKYLSELGARALGREACQKMYDATMNEVLEFCTSDRETLCSDTLTAIEWRSRHRHVFEKMSAPSEIPVPAEPDEPMARTMTRDVIEGRPGATGTATGRVRILRDLRELASLEQGEVIVLPDIKPVWALAFGLVSAVITGEGHLLAHGAIMTREAGIPCVFLGEGARSLSTGDLVRVLGDEGKVEVLSRAT